MPFAKGHSGNPAGRPAGSRNKFTAEMQEALEESGLPLIQRLLELAGQGNAGAMRQCLDRLMGKHRPSPVALPAPDSPNYILEALGEIHRALGAGEIVSDEAVRLVDFVGRTARVLAAKAAAEIDLADRLARCEEALVLLLNAGRPASAQEATPSAAAPAAVTTEPAIINNNAETMTASSAEPASAGAAPAKPPPVAKNDEEALAHARPMSSTSAAARMGAAIPEKAMPAVPSEMPLASAA
jgi:Family of unknown function (DUF5681)